MITKEMHVHARMDYKNNRNDHFDDFLIGWIGFMASFNGDFFRGYTGNHPSRDYVGESIRNVERQVDKIQNVVFHCSSYEVLPIPENSIIYCDIPYRETSPYSSVERFDHDRFWKWCILQKSMGHRVYVSEYTAPEGVECVWSKETTISLNPTITKRPIEKLFRL